MVPTIPAKTILSPYRRDNQWFGTEYNMNLYKGCCHHCIYCDSRSACYHIENFDQVAFKENALETLRNQLSRRIKTGVAATGSMSDPYNPFEAQLCLTRHSLELLNAYQFGAAIATKSNLITRDIDLLTEIREHSPVLCKITVTAAENSLAAQLEPDAPTSTQRFAAIKELAKAGVYTGVLLMPVLPFLTDSPGNIRAIVEQAADCGARFVYPYLGVTLRQNQREYFFAQLEKRFPGIKEQYQKRYGERYECISPRWKELWELFTRLCGQYGLLYKMQDIIVGYRMGYESRQLTLF